MAAPSMTYSATGNVVASKSLAASGVDTTGVLDLSAKFGAWVTILLTTGGTVATTAGLKVEALAGYGTGPTYDTLADGPVYQFGQPVASTTYTKAIWLDTGKWELRITNLDASNAVTISVTSATLDSIS